ncbi:MAG: hypothetical protein ACXQT3_00785 [Methermicoccaceae archaeon]
MVERQLRRTGRNSTEVEIYPNPTHNYQNNLKGIKLSSDTYDELSRLKVALGVSSFDELVRRLIEASEVEPLKVADRKIEQLEEEIGELVPHAFSAVSQSLVLARVALRLPRERCEHLQLELLSLQRGLVREEEGE